MRKLLPILISPLALTGCEHLPQDLPMFSAPSFNLPTFESGFTADEGANETDKKTAASPIKEVHTQGLKAWLVEDHSLPLVSVQLMFEGAGSSSDSFDKQGRAMMAAALLDEGAGDLNALEFQKALEDKAIQLSFRTDEDVLAVQIRTLSEHLPEAMRLVGMALTDARFDRKDIERKRKLALSQLNEAKTKPGFVLRKTFNQYAYGAHPYGAPPIGNVESLKRISKSDLENYTMQTLTKDRLYMSATGDVNEETFKGLMEEYLSELPDTSMLPTPKATKIGNLGQTEMVKLTTPQSSVLVATPAVDRRDERFFAAYVLNHIVGGDTLTSVLGSAIREKKGLAYSVHSYLDPMSHASGFKVSFSTRNEEVHTALETLKEELVNLAEKGISDEQYKRAIDYITGSFVLSLDNNSNYTRYLNSMQRFALGKDYLETRNEKMRAVTKEQINAMAKELFDPQKWLTIIVGEPKALGSNAAE